VAVSAPSTATSLLSANLRSSSLSFWFYRVATCSWLTFLSRIASSFLLKSISLLYSICSSLKRLSLSASRCYSDCTCAMYFYRTGTSFSDCYSLSLSAKEASLSAKCGYSLISYSIAICSTSFSRRVSCALIYN